MKLSHTFFLFAAALAIVNGRTSTPGRCLLASDETSLVDAAPVNVTLLGTGAYADGPSPGDADPSHPVFRPQQALDNTTEFTTLGYTSPDGVLPLSYGSSGSARAACSNSAYDEASVFACMNAARVNPGAFSYPCSAWWLGGVQSPQRQALRSSSALSWAAEQHSNEMAATGIFSHSSPNGAAFTSLIAASGWRGFPQGQNIAAGQTSALDVVMQWMCSEGHRTNLMSCNYDSVGTGVVTGGAMRVYYTQDFGCSGSSNCNSCGAASTSYSQYQAAAPSPSVSLAAAARPVATTTSTASSNFPSLIAQLEQAQKSAAPAPAATTAASPSQAQASQGSGSVLPAWGSTTTTTTSGSGATTTTTTTSGNGQPSGSGPSSAQIDQDLKNLMALTGSSQSSEVAKTAAPQQVQAQAAPQAAAADQSQASQAVQPQAASTQPAVDDSPAPLDPSATAQSADPTTTAAPSSPAAAAEPDTPAAPSPTFSASVCVEKETPALTLSGVHVIPYSVKAYFTLTVAGVEPGTIVTFLSASAANEAAVQMAQCGAVSIGLSGDVQTAPGGAADAQGTATRSLSRTGAACASLYAQAVLRLPDGTCALSPVIELGPAAQK